MPTELWLCDGCRAVYTTRDEALLCEEEHEAELRKMVFDEIRERLDEEQEES